MREMKLLIFLKKELFRINVMYLKQKKKTNQKKNQKKNNFFEYIANESKSINYDLFEKHFSLVVPTVLAKKLYETKDKNKNNELVSVINSGLPDLKDEIKKMSDDEKKKLKIQIKY